MIHFKPIEHHIEDRAHARLCDGRPASDADISSSDWSALRDARKDTTLCPDCQDRMHPLDIEPELYGMGRHTDRTPVCRACAGRLRLDKELLALPPGHRR